MNHEYLVFLGCVAIACIVSLRLLRALSLTKAVLAIVAIVCLYMPPTQATESKEPVVVVNDFMCGIHRVQINDYAGLMVDSQPYGDYKTTMLDAQSNYVHQFGEKAEIRVTQYSRVAFRLAGETRWASCTPLVFHEVEQ